MSEEVLSRAASLRSSDRAGSLKRDSNAKEERNRRCGAREELIRS